MITIAFLIALLSAVLTYFFRHEAWAALQAIFGLALRRRLTSRELIYATLTLIPCALLGSISFIWIGIPVMAVANFFSCTIVFPLAFWVASQEERLTQLVEKPEWYDSLKPSKQLVHNLNNWAAWAEKKNYIRFAEGLNFLASMYERF